MLNIYWTTKQLDFSRLFLTFYSFRLDISLKVRLTLIDIKLFTSSSLGQFGVDHPAIRN